MKLNGVFGKGTGKVGNSVWAVSGGVQIVRPYNPNVSNPNTDAQMEQRAKLKLMSQLAAALADVIAFKKQGLVSARNQFISANIGKCTFTEGKAKISIPKLDLTGGSVSIPDMEINVDQQNNLGVQLEAAAPSSVSAMVYIATTTDANDQLIVHDVKMSTTPGDSRLFSVSFPNIPGDGTILAYGIINASARELTLYQNYEADQNTEYASLEVSLKDVVKNGTKTKTNGGLWGA